MSHQRRAGHGRRLTVVLSALLLTAGLGLLGVFLHAQVSAAEPPLTSSARADGEAASVPAPSTPVGTAPTPASTKPPTALATPAPVAAPVAVSIPAIGVRSVVNMTGVDSQGAIQAPARGPHYNQAAWFSGSPKPGQTGPAVIVGHIDGPGDRTSVFFKLGALKHGARVTVTRADHSVVTFEVYRVERYAKDDFPTVAVYGNTTGPELRLITCGGSFDRSVGHYRDNTVAYARMVSG